MAEQKSPVYLYLRIEVTGSKRNGTTAIAKLQRSPEIMATLHAPIVAEVHWDQQAASDDHLRWVVRYLMKAWEEQK